ncbi:cytochrome c oxidase assembly protein [Iodobacter fluviatilis]|uniref:Cytochrome c oxidase assembly protein CtaG n=1 Tax=Iodobacter fluviatilis TaxID=537 RepID=A0A377SW75_9NEIS|nr:cytochrome c oxidase assembly protein [Iodobacter fluviatilis]TCU86165.1 cytochrome c oxidase assembly protein subunit 11 [Iodobacter fluviatilis]STR44576.1 Cytochrome c oxidase assembly protein CtaG [Iodobacter fluviatilis]
MQSTLQQANRKLAIRMLVIACLMFGFGYAMVPFYGALCKAMGIDRANSDFANVNAAVIRVEFDTNVADKLPATLMALDPVMAAKPGGLIKARFRLSNLSDQPLKVRAIPSFAPARAAGLLQKLECFCFDALTLAPNEQRDVTVVLLVANELPAELGAATLSYTLHPELKS